MTAEENRTCIITLQLSDCKSHASLTLGCVQTGATTPNIVAPTILGVVACVLAVVCKSL